MYWRNSKFQILAFIAGKTHTPDECYRVLLELREERDLSIQSSEVSKKRSTSKLMRLNRQLADPSIHEETKLELEADLLEMQIFEAQGKNCLEVAHHERDFIDLLISKIEPHRKYSHLPLHEANQIIQKEEWCEELKWRAENFLLTQGAIPTDQFETMRVHPDFDLKIAPHIASTVAMLTDVRLNGSDRVLARRKSIPALEFDGEIELYVTALESKPL